MLNFSITFNMIIPRLTQVTLQLVFFVMLIKISRSFSSSKSFLRRELRKMSLKFSDGFNYKAKLNSFHQIPQIFHAIKSDVHDAMRSV